MICTASATTNDRIRRTRDDPVFDERTFRATATITVQHGGEAMRLRHHRSRWEGDPDFPGVHQRVVRARLYVDGSHAGSFTLTEVRPEPLISNYRLFDWADGKSEALSQLAEVICGHWEEVSDVSDRGTILELTRAWMHPAFANGRRFALAANALIALNEDWAVLLLKAFPLEYEGVNDDQVREAQTNRQRAMMRHYRSLFAVSPFPGNAGREGWMYAIRSGLPIEAPLPCDWDDRDVL